jgi:hypothetical protein
MLAEIVHNGNEHSEYSKSDIPRHQSKYADFLAYSSHCSVEQEAALDRLRPSWKADRKYDHQEQAALWREMCTEGMCIRILEDITKWANSSESPRVFWLTSQAGSGKTTIAYTIAKQFEKDGTANQQTILGGNFLCLRQFGETWEQSRIIPTIAYQLVNAIICKHLTCCQ